jgi:heme exporter protein A
MLSARSLACRRGRRLLFSGIDLRLARGSISRLCGANGSGKTSLLRILAGLSQPFEGQVSWEGRPLDAQARASIVYVGHANALKDDLTLAENLAYFGGLAGDFDAARRGELALECLGLASRRNAAVRTLSQGQRRRGALARLALDELPRTWLLDEPYEALDPASAATLSALIEAHAGRGGAVMLASHQPLALAGVNEIDLQRWGAP